MVKQLQNTEKTSKPKKVSLSHPSLLEHLAEEVLGFDFIFQEIPTVQL